MIAMRTPRASLPSDPSTVAIPETASSRACYRILLQCVGTGAKGPMYDAFDIGIDGKPANRLLACYQTLLLAMRDRRLQQRHRFVLAELIEHMNSQTGMTWIGRNKIAENLELAVETISNTLRELSLFGYILAENRRTPETSNRSLRHYTLAGLSKDEIRAKIADAIAAMKASGPRAIKPQASAKATAHSDFESHRPQGLSEAKSPPAMDESHCPPWTVTNIRKLKEVREFVGQQTNSELRLRSIEDQDAYSFNRLFNSWGVNSPKIITGRDKTDALLSNELRTHEDEDPSLVRNAVIQTLNKATVTTPTRSGGRAFLSFFSDELRRTLGSLKISNAELGARTVTARLVAEQRHARVADPTKGGNRGKSISDQMDEVAENWGRS